jgi:hypothetical protein
VIATPAGGAKAAKGVDRSCWLPHMLEHLGAQNQVESLSAERKSVEIRDDELRRREQRSRTTNSGARAVDSDDELRCDRHTVEKGTEKVSRAATDVDDPAGRKRSADLSYLVVEVESRGCEVLGEQRVRAIDAVVGANGVLARDVLRAPLVGDAPVLVPVLHEVDGCGVGRGSCARSAPPEAAMVQATETSVPTSSSFATDQECSSTHGAWVFGGSSPLPKMSLSATSKECASCIQSATTPLTWTYTFSE